MGKSFKWDGKELVPDQTDSAATDEVVYVYDGKKLVKKKSGEVFGQPSQKSASVVPSTSNGLVELGGGIPATEADAKREAEARRIEQRKKVGVPLPEGGVIGFSDNKDPVANYSRNLLTKTKVSLAPQPASTSANKEVVIPIKAKQEETKIKEAERVSEQAVLSEKELTPSQAYDEIKKAENYFRYNQNESAVQLAKSLGITNPNDLYVMPEDQLEKAARPGNRTDQLALEAIKDVRAARKAFSENSDIVSAAIDFAANQNPELKKQLEFLSETGLNQQQTIQEIIDGKQPEKVRYNSDLVLGNATIGSILFQTLNNPIFAQEAKNNPAFATQFKEKISNLIYDNKEFGKVYIANKIAQKMEDEGVNNPLLNIVTKSEADGVVDKLVENGEMNEREKTFYENYIRPRLGLENLWRTINNESAIETTGILESTLKGGLSTAKDIGKGLAEVTNVRNMVSGDQKALSQDIEASYKKTYVKPKGVISEIAQGAGGLLGQAIVTGGSGKLLQSLKLINNANTAIGLTGAMQSYGMYMPEARMMFPGERVKQKDFTTIMAGINFFTGRIFKDTKVIDGIMNKVKPTVVRTIKDFTEKKITSEAARNSISNTFKKAVQDVPEAAKLIAKGMGENTFEEVSAEWLGQLNKNIFEGKDLSDAISDKQLAQVARTTLLSSSFVSALGARADLRNRRGIAATQLYDMGLNADEWKKKITELAAIEPEIAKDADDKIKNLDILQGIVSDLERTDLSYEKKSKIALAELDNAIRKEKVETLSSEILKKAEKEAIKINEEEAVNAINEEDQLSEFNQELTKEELKAVKILGKYELPGIYQDLIEEDPIGVLKDIAQQALGLTESGQPVEGGGRRQSMIEQGFPEELIDEAIKFFPKPKVRVTAEEVESLQPKTQQDAVPIQTTNEVDVRQQTEDGGTMGKGDTKPEVIAGEEKTQDTGKGEKEVGGVPPISEPPLKEPPVTPKSGVYVERPATEISFKGLQDVANEFSLEDVESRDRKSDVQLRADARGTMQSWADEGKYSQNITKLVEQAEQGIPLSDEQRVILEQHLANVIGESREMDKLTPEYDEKLREIKRLKDAGQMSRSAAGAALRVPTGGSRPMQSIEDWFIQEMEDTGVDVLTQDQKQTVSKEYEEFKEAEKAYQDKISQLQKEVTELKAKKNVEEEKKKKTKEKKTSQDYSKERKEIFDSIKEKLKKSRGELSATPIPYAKELIVIAPDVAKLMKSYVEQGIDKLSDLIDKIHTDLSNDIPEITKNDVRDIIAGEYNKKRPTKTDLAERVYDLRQEAKLLNEYEKWLTGKPETESKKVERNKKLSDLRKKISQLKEEKLTEDELNIERLKRVKSTYRAKIADLEDRIKRGDYETEKRVEVELDEEAKELKDNLIKLRNEREYRRMKNILANQTKWEKFQRVTSDVLNVPRSLMASMDFSGLLRQAVVPTVANPKMSSKASIQMFKSAFSQKEYDRWMFDLENSKRFELMQQSGLGITDQKSPALTAREEEFSSNLAEKIPGLGAVVKGSNRAYSQVLNKMRVDLFNKFAGQMEKRGVTFRNNPEAYKQMAKFINNATGRGDLPKKLETAAPFLNAIFFSPRLIASRLNMLTYWMQPRLYKKVPKEVRKAYFKDMAIFIGVGVTVLAMFKAMGAEVEDDPRSSDFGKIKYGGTRWDIWGGFQPYARLFTQIATGERKSTNTGKIQELDGEGPFGDDRMDVLGSFGRGKLAPVPSMVYDIISGRNIVGETVDLKRFDSDIDRKGKKILGAKEYLAEHFLPLSITGMDEAMQDQGVQSWFNVFIPNVFGVGTQTFEGKKQQENVRQFK